MGRKKKGKNPFSRKIKIGKEFKTVTFNDDQQYLWWSLWNDSNEKNISFHEQFKAICDEFDVAQSSILLEHTRVGGVERYPLAKINTVVMAILEQKYGKSNL